MAEYVVGRWLLLPLLLTLNVGCSSAVDENEVPPELLANEMSLSQNEEETLVPPTPPPTPPPGDQAAMLPPPNPAPAPSPPALNPQIAPSRPEELNPLSLPTLGYDYIAVIDRAAHGTTATAQRLALFRFDEQRGNLILQNPELWKVSTGKMTPITEKIKYKDGTEKEVYSDRITPTGIFDVFRVDEKYVSQSLLASMPNAVFFWPGYAIHTTKLVGQLGQRASHGCVRLSNANALVLFQIMNQAGQKDVVLFEKQTGSIKRSPEGAVSIAKRYPMLVIITDTTAKNSMVYLDLAELIKDPSPLMQLFDIQLTVAKK